MSPKARQKHCWGRKNPSNVNKDLGIEEDGNWTCRGNGMRGRSQGRLAKRNRQSFHWRNQRWRAEICTRWSFISSTNHRTICLQESILVCLLFALQGWTGVLIYSVCGAAEEQPILRVLRSGSIYKWKSDFAFNRKDKNGTLLFTAGDRI